MNVKKLELFNSMLYGSSIITPSLGDLIIDCVIMVWWVAFWQIHRPGVQNKTRHSVAALLLLFFVFAFTGLITWIFKTLVIDSIISFEIYNVKPGLLLPGVGVYFNAYYLALPGIGNHH